ncbi:MAG: DNA polymerase III subunit delta [Bacteroidales bacterium]
MLFRDVVGQQEIKERLLKIAKEKRVGHALLFSGREGTGKLVLAIAFARYLNCKNPGEHDACGQCISCIKFSKLEHPDLHFVFPVASQKDKKKEGGTNSGTSSGKGAEKPAKNTVDKDPVSDDFIHLWREAVLANPYMRLFQWYEHIGIENKQGFISRKESRQIIRKLSYKNFEGSFKVMIIWMAEKMNIHAANALLKMFEEPYPGTLFILITEDASQIIPTILSRTQLIKIPAIDRKSLKQAMQENHAVDDKEKADDLVKLADGNYLNLIELIEESEETNYHFNMFVKMMRLCYSLDITGISSWVDDMAAQGREGQKRFFQYALRILRGNFILNIRAGDIDLLSEEEKDFSGNFSKFVHSGNIFALCDEFSRAFVHVEYNGYSRLIFFDLALKTARLLKT